MNGREPASTYSHLRPLDTVVQAATIDVFQDYGVPVAPVPRRVQQPLPPTLNVPETSAIVAFSSVALSGTLALAISQDVFPLLRFGIGEQILPRDCVREFTNQLLGRLKSRLTHFQVVLNAGLPSLANVEKLKADIARSTSVRLYSFATLKGDILVCLDGKFDESQLKYSGTQEHVSEGDVILF